MPSTPAKPCIAAEPVSPLVAVSTSTRRPAAAWRMKTGSIDRATSLNAPVRPWKSSRKWSAPFSTTGTGSAAGKRERSRSTASLRTPSGMSPKNSASTSSSALRSVSAERMPAISPTPTGRYSPPSRASPRKTVSTPDACSPVRVEM